MSAPALELQDALRIVRESDPAAFMALTGELNREALKNKGYRDLPLGQDVAAYLRVKRKRLADASERAYESSLDKLARHFPDLRVEDFEPPIGTDRLEEYLEQHWGRTHEPSTYNTNLSITSDFFKFWVRRGRLHGDPTLLIDRARKGQVHRTTFTGDQRRAILASREDLGDRLALRLLLDYGIRKGSLQAVQFKHFDHHRKRLTIFAKGGKVRELPLPDPAFWNDLGRFIIDVGAQPNHFLLCRRAGRYRTRQPEKPIGVHGAHAWWYRCLEDAGIVPQGTTSGERMHKARHTAGQRMLDTTGNLKAVQKLLGHASIQTTGDIYADWDLDQLAASIAQVLAEDDDA